MRDTLFDSFLYRPALLMPPASGRAVRGRPLRRRPLTRCPVGGLARGIGGRRGIRR